MENWLIIGKGVALLIVLLTFILSTYMLRRVSDKKNDIHDTIYWAAMSIVTGAFLAGAH